MQSIKSLKGIGIDDLFEAFSEAFKDYEFQINKIELERLMLRRGFVPESSFGMFVKNKIVSFTFNGIGSFNGKETAYDVATGTIKEYRGRGYATKIFQHSIPFLKEQGVTQYLLEVLQHNPKAVSVYKKIGFIVSREFNYYTHKNEDLKLYSKSMSADYQIKQIDFSGLELLNSFWDFDPSWQNSFDSILRKPDDFRIIGAFYEQSLVGYCVLEIYSGDITQIAVHKNHRRKGIGTSLLKEILDFNLHHSIKIVNIEVECESMNGFIKANSIPQRGKQFEMVKEL